MYNFEFKIMDARKLNFPENYFDAVWANAIYVHIAKKDIEVAVMEVFRVLKKQGIFYISVKEGEGEKLEPDERYGNVVKYWAYYKKGEFEQYLMRMGFTVLESTIKTPNDGYSTHPWTSILCRK